MSSSSINSKGREYVSQAEFARRADVSEGAVSRAIARGVIKTSAIKGMKKPMIDVEKELPAFLKTKKNHPKTQRRGGYQNLSAWAGTGSAKVRKENITEEAITEEVVGEISDKDGNATTIYNVNINAFPDCWVRGASGAVIHDENGTPLMDWKLYDQKIKGLIHTQQYDEKAGRLIEKEYVTQRLAMVLGPVSFELSSLKDKHASAFISIVESYIGHSLPDEGRNMIRAELRKIADRVCSELEVRIKEAF